MDRLVSFLQLFVQRLFSQQGESAVLLGAGAAGVMALIVLAVLLALKKRLHPYRRALRLRERGDLSGAIGQLALAREDRETGTQSLLLKADLEVETGAWEEAVRDYYRLIRMKTPGDGLDLLEVKKKLLQPLYRLEHLLELIRMCREVLGSEKKNPEALYYLGLVYLGQLYAGEACRILEEVVGARPRMHQALFALAVAHALERRYGPAAGCLARARAIENLPIYGLVHAGIRYLEGGYRDAVGVLETLPGVESGYRFKKQYHLYLRVRALCTFRLGDSAEAERDLGSLYRELRALRPAASAPGPEPVDHSGWGLSLTGAAGVYNEFGRKGTQRLAGQPPASGSGRAGGTAHWSTGPGRTGDSTGGPRGSDAGRENRWKDYYRLKELALEEGRTHLVRVPPSPGRMLDIEGLTEASRVALGLVFAPARQARYSAALGALEGIREDHPEVTGLRKLKEALREEERIARGNEMDPGLKPGRTDGSLHEDSPRRDAGRRFRLEDYLRAWENDALRPYHLAAASGLLSRKRVNPGALFRRDGQFGLDL
ncbi:MAG: hypothetical protein ACOC8N_05875 [Spirochaetota bacterium]